MGFLYDRWQSDSALVQGCTKRAEAYACTLQIVVPLADRASCAEGRYHNSNHFRKGWKRPGRVILFPIPDRRLPCVIGAPRLARIHDCRIPDETVGLMRVNCRYTGRQLRAALSAMYRNLHFAFPLVH